MTSIEFRSRVPLGSLHGKDLRLAARTMGVTNYQLDRLINNGDLPYWHQRSAGLQGLLRENEGPSDLREAAHAALLAEAQRLTAYLADVLQADVVLKDNPPA